MLLEQREICFQVLLRISELCLQDLAVPRTPERKLTPIRVGPGVEPVSVVVGVVDSAFDRTDVETPQYAGKGDEEIVACQVGAGADAAAPAEAGMAELTRVGLALLLRRRRQVLFGQVVQRRRVDVQEPQWVEVVWVRVECFVPVDRPAVAQDIRPLGDVVAPIRVRFGRGVRRASQNGDGPPAQRFLAHCSDIGERRLVGIVWETIAPDHGVEFGVCSDQDFLVRDEGEDRG